MKGLEQALVELVEVLERVGVPYMVIGGMANMVWGVVRATVDVDVTVLAEEEKLGELLEALRKQFAILQPNPEEHIERNRFVTLKSSGETQIDLIFALLPFEEAAIERAVEKEVAGRKVKFCTAEDLIVHKIFSQRHQDQEDVRGIVRVQQKALDLEYLEPVLHQLAETLADSQLLEFWENIKREELRV